MPMINWTKFLPIGIPLSLAACGGQSADRRADYRGNHEPDQAISTVQGDLAPADLASGEVVVVREVI